MTTSSLLMNMSIVKVGVDYLKQTRLAGQQGYFSGFRFGSSFALNIDENTTNVGGTTTYFGSPSEMSYTKVSKYEVLLRAVIDHTRGDFDIGSFAFLVGPSQIPFFVGKFPYVHKKMATTEARLGGRFTVQVKFKMYDMDVHWSFANLAASYARADKSVPHYTNIPDTFVESPGYMLQIDTVPSPSNRKGYLLYGGTRGLSWRSPDLQAKHADPFWKINGGSDGDGHLY